MLPLSQNNKIGISAIAMFALSIVSMVVFLKSNDSGLDNGKANILELNSHEETTSHDADLALEVMYKDFFDAENPVLMTDAEGKVEFASEDFCLLLLVECESLKEVSIFDLINSKDLSEFASQHTKLIQNAERIEAIGPLRMLQKDKEILVLIGAHPMLGAEHKVENIVFSFKDLTEQVEELNDEDLEKDEEEAEEKEWLQDLYPHIKDMENLEHMKIVMEQISYLK